MKVIYIYISKETILVLVSLVILIILDSVELIRLIIVVRLMLLQIVIYKNVLNALMSIICRLIKLNVFWEEYLNVKHIIKVMEINA